jgi:ABC-type hemin transport system substrate-binding protein
MVECETESLEETDVVETVVAVGPRDSVVSVDESGEKRKNQRR